MKKLFVIFTLCLLLASCSDNQTSQPSSYNQPDSQVNVVVQQKPTGLDLQALGELAKKSTNAKQLEDSLNQPGGINNVDLNSDGKVDYLNVAEFGNGNTKGFSVVDYTANSTGGVDTNEIANITFTKDQSNPQAATVNINGNTNIYGNNSTYQTSSLLSDLLIYNYLFSYHPYYYSPYHYGYYPSYYHSYRPLAYDAYNSRVRTTYRTTTYKTVSPSTTRTTVSSPYSGKTSASVRTNFSAQTSSSKSFSVRDNSKPVNNTGFTNKSSSSSSSNKSSGGGWFSSGSGSGSSYKSSSSSSSSPSRSYSSSSSSRSSGGGFSSSSSRSGRR